MKKLEKYKLSSENKKQIKNYLQKMEKFVKENNLEKELYEDIEERFFEKLSETKNINKVEIKKIIAELGEIEDIFGDEIEKSKKEISNNYKAPFFNKNYSTKEKWISIGILVFWTMLLINIITLTSPSSAFIKIVIMIIIILLARWTSNFKDIGGTAKRDLANIKKPFSKIGTKNMLIGIPILVLVILAIGGIVPKNITVFLVFGFLLLFIIGMLLKPGKNIIKSVFGVLYSCFKFLFFTGFGIFLSLGVLGLLAVAGAYFTDFHYEGMQIFTYFPLYFPIGIGFGTLALIIFSVSFISYGFSKKGFGKNFLLFGVFSLFIAFFCAFATGFDLFKKYSYSEEIQKTYEFDIKKIDGTYNLVFYDLMNVSYRMNYNFGFFKYIDIKKSKDDKLRITTKLDIHSPKENMKFFKENLASINLNQEKNNLFFSFENGKVFGDKTIPLFFSNSYLEVEIPENMTFETKQNHFISQIIIQKKYEYLEPYINTRDCKTYFYDKDLANFSCDFDEKYIKEREQMLKVKELYKNLSNLSPIKHKNEYKRNYYLEVCHFSDNFNCRSDWMINYESIKIENGTINFTYFDQSLKIKASVKITEQKPGNYNFSDFKIKEINKNSNFNERFYEKESLIDIPEEIKTIKEEKTAKNKQTAFKDYTSYDAGIFEGNKSLSFDNLKAKSVRKITKNNGFLKNWKHPFYYSLANNGKNREGKKIGNFNVIEQTDSNNEIYYIVKKNGKEIYKSDKTNFLTQEPFKNFVVNNDGWWLFYQKVVIKSNSNIISKNILVHNGKIVENTKTLNLEILDGKVFYFFTKDKDSKISFYLDGKIFKTNFDEIIHNKCCEPGAYNMKISNDGRVAFWGIIGENFSYNEMKLAGF